eukprot:COSAG05_NODE_2430_length_3070_cov_114.952035_1_plen_102_part_00
MAAFAQFRQHHAESCRRAVAAAAARFASSSSPGPASSCAAAAIPYRNTASEMNRLAGVPTVHFLKPKHWFARPPRARASSAVEEPSAHFVFDVAAIRPDAA